MGVITDKALAKNLATEAHKITTQANTAAKVAAATQYDNKLTNNGNANGGKDPKNDGGKKPSGGGNWYGGGGGSGGSSAPAAAPVDWASKIGTNPDAMNQYLNPNGTPQNEALMKQMEGTPGDYLTGTEGFIPTTDDSFKATDDMMANAGIGGKDYFAGAGINGDVNIDRLEHVNIDEEKNMLDQLTEAQKQQAILNSDRTVAKGTSDLQRAMEDAQDQYTTQRNQIAADEARAKDNQALYAEARGDRGGIGSAQYDTIQNTAATNRYMVQQEQTKLATATQRQIADLRAQGEFEKANQLLGITQDYLGKLMNLYTWAKETNLGIDQFNTQIAQWEENYKMSLLNAELDVSNMRLNTFSTLQNSELNQLNAQINLANAAQNSRMNNLNAALNVAEATGTFGDGTPTFQARLNAVQQLANSGNALMQAGVAPTAEQLAAMGLTQDQAVAYLKKYFPGG